MTQAEEAVKYFLSQLPLEDILRVYTMNDANRRLLEIWTVIDKHNERLENRVYGLEAKTMDKFPNLPWDFHLIWEPETEWEERFVPENADRVYERPGQLRR